MQYSAFMYHHMCMCALCCIRDLPPTVMCACACVHMCPCISAELSPLKSVYSAEALLRTLGWQSVTPLTPGM